MGLQQKVRMEAHIYLNSAQVMEKKIQTCMNVML